MQAILICAAVLVVCLGMGSLMRWLTEVEECPPAKVTRPKAYAMQAPCDHCGKVDGELLGIGIWHADGEREGVIIGTDHYVLCRHCREQAFAECQAVLDSRLTVG